eukprot:m.123931 g.123931  ORF g.123931 m.123931 type:complete len:64 (-) comp13481_c0_seq2:514-705(-)
MILAIEKPQIDHTRSQDTALWKWPRNVLAEARLPLRFEEHAIRHSRLQVIESRVNKLKLSSQA